MSNAEQQIKRIQDKLQQLLKQHAALQKENIKLREELAEAGKVIKIHQQTTDELKQQVSILKMNAVDMNDTDKKEFEKRISAYVKEIDRCIALLGK